MLDPVFRSKLRCSLTAFCFFFLYGILLVALWKMQVTDNENTLFRMRKQYVRNVVLPAVRGRILTSDGGVLAGNRPVYNIVFHTLEMRQPGYRSNTIRHIAAMVRKTASAIGRKEYPSDREISAFISFNRGAPLTVFEDLSSSELATAYELSSSIPGMDIVCLPERTYPHGTLAGTLIGYIRSEEPLNAAGLEYFYDSWNEELVPSGTGAPAVRQKHPLLRGTPGKKMVYVDPRGFVREEIGTVLPAENGKDLILTLDLRMQKIAEKLMNGHAGVFLLMDAENGDILSMVSSPSYAPGEFIPKISRERYNALANDPGHPMMNRAVRGEYAPGSIIKPLMAGTLLENGFGTEETIRCDGATHIGGAVLRCWILSVTGGGHGALTLREALTVSCNDFFVEAGQRLGLDAIAEIYSSAGIGTKTGFPLTEASGRLPARSHKKRWTPFDTALVSIGQGDVLVTPLQAAVYLAAIANGGTRYVPRILKSIRDQDGNTVFRQEPAVAGKLAITPEHLAYIREAMRNAVTAPNGSCRHAANDYVELSGKTGTAEIGAKVSKNVWFAGFGRLPVSGRLCSVIIFVENGASGGKTAAPVASEFFTELGKIMSKEQKKQAEENTIHG